MQRQRDEALAEGGRLARTPAMGRQAPENVTDSDDDADGRVLHADRNRDSNSNEVRKVERERRNSSLYSIDAGYSNTPEGLENQVLELLQSNLSMSSQATRKADADFQWHKEEERRECIFIDVDNRRINIDKRRLKVK